MPLILTQTSRHYMDGDRSVALRVIAPSPPHGYWPGNTHTIREWTATNATAAYETCSDADVRRYEAELGEVSTDALSFAEHVTLGRVVVVK